jgi:DNA polymerase III delta subunit
VTGPGGVVPDASAADEPVRIGFYDGDDAYGIERAALALGERATGPDGTPLRVVRVHGAVRRAADAEARLAAIAEGVATASLFGGGTLVVVTDVPTLVRSAGATAALVETVGLVAPGNALALLAQSGDRGKGGSSVDPVRKAVAAAGGEVRTCRAPDQRTFVAWVTGVAAELGVRIEGPAAQELARRVGALEPGSDVDRRELAATAVAELRKLQLYRPDRAATIADVRAVVAERTPASLFRLVDAVAERRPGEAIGLLERSFEAVAGPVLVVRLHRRLRDLAIAADLAGAGAKPPSVGEALGIDMRRSSAEWQVGRVLEQSRRWTGPELAAALDGLLAVDARMKGERSAGERAQRLELTLWIAERVASR